MPEDEVRRMRVDPYGFGWSDVDATSLICSLDAMRSQLTVAGDGNKTGFRVTLC